jgi:hypothetical protein
MSEGIHVRHQGDRWLVTRGNYLLDEFKSQQQALALATQRARSSKASLTIHSEDGTVRKVDQYKDADTLRRPRRSA